MAAGHTPSGQGVRSFRLAELYVDLTVRDAPYVAGLNRAMAALQRFAQQARATWQTAGMAAWRSQASLTMQSARSLAAALQQVARAARQANAALGGGAAGPLAQVIRAQGSAQAASIRAIGQGLGSALRGAASGFGQGLGSALRGAAPLVRAFGTGLGAAARGFGSLLSAGLRGAASLVRALVGSLTAGVRTAVGMLTSRAALIGGLVGAGVGGLSVAGVAGAAIDMEWMVTRLGRAAELSGERLGKLADSMKDMAARMAGPKLADIFGIGVMGGRLGVGAGGRREELELFTSDLSRVAAVLEDLGIDQAATQIARLMQVFGRGAHEAINFASALNKLDLSTSASAQDILDITQRFSGAAAVFGMKPQEALALATTIRAAGVPRETSGTSIGQIMMRMASGKDMGGFAKLAGMRPREFRRLMETDVLSAITSVAVGIERLERAKGPVAVSQALETLSLDGQRVRMTMLGLAKSVDALRRNVRVANEDWRTNASILESFALIAETARAMWERLRNNFQLTAAALGTALLPVVKQVTTALGHLLTDVREYLERNGGAMAAWGERVGGVLARVGVLFRNWSDFVGLARSTALEFFDRVGEVATRWPQRVARFWGSAFGNLASLLRNTFEAAVTYISNLIPQVASRVGAELNNALASVIASNRALTWLARQAGINARPVAVPAIDFNAGAPGQVPRGAQGPPNPNWWRRGMTNPFAAFRGLLDDLPNRDAEQAGFRDRIVAGRRDQEADFGQREARARHREDAAREAARGRHGEPDRFRPAEPMRRMSPAERRRRVLVDRARRAALDPAGRRKEARDRQEAARLARRRAIRRKAMLRRFYAPGAVRHRERLAAGARALGVGAAAILGRVPDAVKEQEPVEQMRDGIVKVASGIEQAVKLLDRILQLNQSDPGLPPAPGVGAE